MMTKKTKAQLIKELARMRRKLSEYKAAEAQHKRLKKMMIDTDRRLQEHAQQLLIAKQEEQRQKEELRHELNTLKHLAGPAIKKEVEPIEGKKLTKSIAEDLSLWYIQLLRSYMKTKDLNKDESLAEDLCQKLIEYGVTPKGIIDIHLKTVPQIKTIGDLETKRVTFESRMVLLKVMTNYASLLRGKFSTRAKAIKERG